MKKLTFIVIMFFCFFAKTENAQAQNCEFNHSYFWYNNSEEAALDNSCGAGEMFYGRPYKRHSIRSQRGSDCWLNCVDALCISANASSAKCLKCSEGYLLKNGLCESCPENAVCDGTTTFICDSGYTVFGNSCIKGEKKNTVSSCPSRMTLSADGCCCINKQ